MAAYKERSPNASSSSASCMFLPQTYSLTHHSSQSGSGIVNPSQVFVGGFGFKTRERELRDFFSQYGTVREVKIVVDYWGVSKGYGFVTFATEEEALSVLVHADRLYRDKKLCIRQAVYRQAPRHNDRVREAYYNPSVAPPRSREPVKTTSTGFFYTYYNGEAYFFNPSTNPPAHPWLAPPPSETPLQSYCVDNRQAACHYNQPPVSFSPVTLSQQSEYFNRAADGGSVVPPLPFTDAPAENVAFPHLWAYLNPKYHRDVRQSAYQYP